MREVLNEYHHTYISKEYPALNIYGYPLDNIEKDLELLEILKKYTTIQQNTHNVWFDNEYFINGKKCSEKEGEIIREWLDTE